jgi:predicted AAA+ superfamily ATPase
MGIKRVWEVCEPHPDVFARDLDPSLFAASLGQVDAGTAPQDYVDAERFFKKTYMTRSLSTLLEGVLARLGAGLGRGTPILQLQTPFGGGKTHTLVALYHLGKRPETAEQSQSVQDILTRLKMRTIPRAINVAVLDGVSLSARGRQIDGLELQTLWGELSYQLGGKKLYREVQDSDKARTPPGDPTLGKVLSAASPALILVDELLAYLLKAKTQAVGASNLMEQTGVFLQELTAAVSANPRTILIASLPASSQEVPEASEEEAQRLFAFIQKVMGRVEMIETPVAEDEVFGVLRLRLFKDWGAEKQRDVKHATDGFADYYAQFARSFPDKLRTPNYKARMVDAYPFHPELIDLLYNRWGPHPKFQRTRGALRLLALTIRRMWDKRPGSSFLIQPCHLELSDRHLRGEVVKLVGSEFDAVVTGDVTNKSVELDKELGGDYRREELAKGDATSAFLYSVNGIQEQGATEEEIRVALLRPQVNPAMCAEVLSQLRDRLHFLVYRDRRYRFQAKANINKLLLDYETDVAGEQIEAVIREALEAVSGNGKTKFRVRAWPKETREIEDRADPALIFVPPSIDGRSSTEWMQNIVQNCGDGYRTHKNAVVFVVASGDMSVIRARARRLEALRLLHASGQYRSMDSEDR